MKQEETNISLDRKSKCLDVPGLDVSSITSTPSATTVHPMPDHSQTRMFSKPRTTRGIHSKSVANAGGLKNVERNVARTLGSAESKVR